MMTFKLGGAMRLLLIFLVLGLTACHSGWDKDPFANEADNVKNGVPPEKKDTAVAPIQSVLFIDIEPFYELKIGQKAIIQIGLRKTDPAFTVTGVSVPDLEENYPGAVFDETKMQVIWTPEEDYVPESAFIRRTPLEITVYGEYQGAPRSYSKTTSINVLKGNATPPEIISVEGMNQDFVEGSVYEFKVVVRDRVSPKGPSLSAVKSGIGNNGSAYLDYPAYGIQDFNDPSLWNFLGKVDLTKVSEITENSEKLRINFIAHSTFGEPSNLEPAAFKVYTDLKTPIFFNEKVKTFKKGTLNSYSFTVVDAKSEGKVEGLFVTDCTREPYAGSVCDCTPPKGAFSTCTIEWVPQKVGTFDFEVKGINRLTINGSLAEREMTQKIKIEVKE